MFYTRHAQELLETAFNNEFLVEGSYLDGYVSRKKQIVPSIMEVLNRAN